MTLFQIRRIEVHRTLGGPGLLESLYEDALYQELKMRSVLVQSQVQVPVIYKNHPLREAMRLDLTCGTKSDCRNQSY